MKKLKSKQKIIAFMKRKSEIIEKETGCVYFNELDEKTIKNWSLKVCDDVLSDMGVFFGDIYSCPFCLRVKFHLKSDVCRLCAYGKRHGICTEPDSLYQELKGINHYILDYKYELKEILLTGVIDAEKAE